MVNEKLKNLIEIIERIQTGMKSAEVDSSGCLREARAGAMYGLESGKQEIEQRKSGESWALVERPEIGLWWLRIAVATGGAGGGVSTSQQRAVTQGGAH